jgi:hypothetical protein
LFRPTLNPALLHKAAREMRVHDAYTAFSFELILIRLIDRLAKARRVWPVAAAEPVLDQGTKWISVWHRWIHSVEVHFTKNEIANIIDPVAAEVTPEIWAFRCMPFESLPLSE